ncbi:MAG: hypothetical protein K5637_00525 [Lachnospiraceae bacterium]|nr:hypothetical protein [Lachnospiraceae bacterium]
MGAGFYIVLLIVLIVAVKFGGKLLYAGLNKGENAVSNAIKRSQEENNPPQAVRLASRYQGVSIPDYAAMYGLTVNREITAEADNIFNSAFEASDGSALDEAFEPSDRFTGDAFNSLEGGASAGRAFAGTSYGDLGKKLAVYGMLAAFAGKILNFVIRYFIFRFTWSMGLYYFTVALDIIAGIGIAAAGAAYILRYLNTRDNMDLITGAAGILSFLVGILAQPAYRVFPALIVGIITGAFFLILSYRAKPFDVKIRAALILGFAGSVISCLISAIYYYGYYRITLVASLSWITVILMILALAAGYIFVKKDFGGN